MVKPRLCANSAFFLELSATGDRPTDATGTALPANRPPVRANPDDDQSKPTLILPPLLLPLSLTLALELARQKPSTMVINPFFPPAVADAAAVGVGAVCGALCRHQIGQSLTKQIAKDPKRFGHLTGWHTAGINVVGSFILGGIFATPVVTAGAGAPAAATKAAATSAAAPSKVPINVASYGLTARAKLLAGVGFCGSFTTFSTYSVDIVNMIGRGDAARAMGYIAVNNIGGVGAAAAGMLLVRKLIAGK